VESLDLLEVSLALVNKANYKALSSSRDTLFNIAGDTVTIAIQNVDQNNLRYCAISLQICSPCSAGDIVCHADRRIPVCSVFTARVITFEAARPLIQGSSVSYFIICSYM
jgi:translation elongation factor EF-1alpha